MAGRSWARWLEPQFRWDGFFTARLIDFKDYPVAQTLSQFMVAHNRKRYLSFINGMKDGMEWEPCLEASFGMPRQKLIADYLKWMDVRKTAPAAPGGNLPKKNGKKSR